MNMHQKQTTDFSIAKKQIMDHKEFKIKIEMASFESKGYDNFLMKNINEEKQVLKNKMDIELAEQIFSKLQRLFHNHSK